MKMKQKELEQLLKRYLKDSSSEFEKLEVERWFEDISNNDIDLSESEKIEIKDRMLARILEAREQGGSEPAVRGRQLIFRVAASLLLMIASFVAYQQLSQGEPETIAVTTSALSDEVVVENNSKGTREIWLPDGTQVILKGESKISYARQFSGKKREVNLVGEAFFDVIRNPDRPFFVYSGNIVTRVLGTSFSMVAPENASTIEVNVVSGRVSVYESEEGETDETDQKKVKKGVILTRNQKATFFVKETHLVTSLVEQPRPVKVPTRENKLLVFEDNTLGEIASKLEENYSIEFVMENASISNCTFTGDLSDMSLFDLLSVIGKSVGVEYEVMGTKILLNGQGCQKQIVN
jgi:transmembrane sensor